MQLAAMAKLLFPRLEVLEEKFIVLKPRWLVAAECEGWIDGELVKLLLVYRSPLVKHTDDWYRPVAEAVVGAEKVTVVLSGTEEDESMMFGEAEYLCLILSGEHKLGTVDPSRTQEVIEHAIRGE